MTCPGAQSEMPLKISSKRQDRGDDRRPGKLITGNPPYLMPEIVRFCQKAGACTNPVLGILPAICAADRSDLDCVAQAEASGGRVIARFGKHSRAFTPFGFWFGEETAGLERFVPAEIVFVIWNADTMPLRALEELQELLELSVKAGTWPVTQDDTFWQQYKAPPATVTADPLRSI